MDAVTLTKVAERVATNLHGAEVIALVPDQHGFDQHGYFVVAWSRKGDHAHNFGTHSMIVYEDGEVGLISGNYIKTEAEAIGDALRRARLDVGAQIHRIMDGGERSPDTLDEIARVLTGAGYEIRDPNDMDDEPETISPRGEYLRGSLGDVRVAAAVLARDLTRGDQSGAVKGPGYTIPNAIRAAIETFPEISQEEVCRLNEWDTLPCKAVARHQPEGFSQCGALYQTPIHHDATMVGYHVFQEGE